MSNYEEKEAKALVKIADVLNKLDSNLEELDSLNDEAGKYDKYDEKELQKEIEHVEQYM